ncbi:unnamed protein product [Linum trigynum]|uniref:Uncharacterized protein n=1 Tax=Linum trigynum TaxID=586398 RepID=A0AAV2FPV4_9ROSI
MTALIEDIATKGYDWGSMRFGGRAAKRGVHSTEVISLLTAKIDQMINALLEDKNQVKKSLMACDDWWSSTNHEIADCQLMKEASTPEEQVSYIANARGNHNPYSNTYNPGWQNHPNFTWSSPSNSRPPGFQGPTENYQPRPPFILQRPQFQASNFQQQPFQTQCGQGFQQQHPDKFAKLEDLVTTFVSTSSQKFEKIEQFMDRATNFFPSVEVGLRSHQASLQNLEIQIGILSGILTKRPRGALPFQTIANPKDQNVGLNVILLRSWKVTLDVVSKEVIEEEKTPPTVDDQEISEGEGEEAKNALPTSPLVVEYEPPLLFPMRVHKGRLEVECGTFMEILKKLHISMPFLEAMTYFPWYAKYRKGLLAKKQKFEDHATVILGEECSTFILNKFPKKQ